MINGIYIYIYIYIYDNELFLMILYSIVLLLCQDDNDCIYIIGKCSFWSLMFCKIKHFLYMSFLYESMCLANNFGHLVYTRERSKYWRSRNVDTRGDNGV